MPAPSSKFELLLHLAREPSSDQRRALLLQISDMLARDPGARTDANCAAFDDIAGAVVSDLKSEVRSEIARMFAASALPVARTLRQLAMDEIEVARPVLEHSTILTEGDLLDVVASKSQHHLIAVAKRSDIRERLSDALVSRGDDHVVASLLVNESAKISRDTYERVAERAQSSVILQAPFVRREGVPLDLLNDLYVSVATELRQEILKQYENVSPAELEAALERGRTRVAKAYGKVPEDLEAARRALRKLEREGQVKPMLLVRLMREGSQSRTLFLLAFAKLTDVDHELIRRLIDARDVDAVALLCRGAGFERALFLTLALLVTGGDQGRADLEQFGSLYQRVPVQTAQRAIRFWKVRESVSSDTPDRQSALGA
jgi:uncharacterized protein (DUF2336 family)